MEQVVIRNCNSVCRLCLSEDDYNMISIFDETRIFLPQRIAACVNVEVRTTDLMPTTICKQCLNKVDDWFEFKQRCDDSQAKLRYWSDVPSTNNKQIYQTGLQIKEEPEAEEQNDLNILSNIKVEPIEAYNYEEQEQEEIIEHLDLTSPYESFFEDEISIDDSLLIPTLELPSNVHGLDGPVNKKSFIEVANGNLSISQSNYCRICNRYFTKYSNRLRHERSIHCLDLDNLTCERCDDIFTNEAELVTHSKIIHAEYNNIDNLSQTNDITNSSVELTTCTSYNDPTSSCQIASAGKKSTKKVSHAPFIKFANKLRLLRANPEDSEPVHLQSFISFHNRINKIINDLFCDICDKKCGSRKNIMNHLLKTNIINRYTCYFCFITMQNRSEFMKHKTKRICKQRARVIKRNPSQAHMNFICELCNNIHVHTTQMKLHLKSHLLKPRPENCEKCLQYFQNDDEYSEHISGPCFYKIYCSICEKRFISESDFNSHSITHQDSNINRENFDVFDEADTPKYWINKCVVCLKDFSSAGNLRRHYKNLHPKYKIKTCQYCDRDFKNTTDLLGHIEKMHSNIDQSYESSNNFSCVQCGSLFNTLNKWCEHQKTHLENNIFHCIECDKEFSSSEELENHKSTHSNIKLKLYRCLGSNSYKTKTDFSNSPTFSCQFCDKYFISEDELNEHAAVHNNNKKSVRLSLLKNKCSICSKVFKQNSELVKHKKEEHNIPSKIKNSDPDYTPSSSREHSHNDENMVTSSNYIKSEPVDYFEIKKELDENLFMCPTCKKVCTTEKGLLLHSKIHIQRIHNDVDSLKCQVCPEHFENIELLLDHLKSHSTKSLHNMFNLKNNHVNVTQSEKNNKSALHKCPDCPKRCLTQNALTSHIRFKHPKSKYNKKVINYLHCKICNKSFDNQPNLNKHLKMHAKHDKPEKKFRCKECPKRYVSELSLSVHAKTHLKNYCSLCDKSFISSGAFRSHKGWHFRSEFCSKKLLNSKYDSKEELLKIVKQENEQLHCEFCLKEFVSEKLLLKHVKVTHPQEVKTKPKKYKKKINPYTIIKTEKSDVQSEKVYRCMECNSAFHKAKDLRSHILASHPFNIE